MKSINKENVMGCFIGLAVGDAYGTTYEFKNRTQLPEKLPNSLIGGGPFNLKPGDWTDDTSMALCLAESIIEKGWNPKDQMERYIDWWKKGHNSVTGECFDIGGATSKGLSWFIMTEGKSFVTDKNSAGNGVLMRLAAIPIVYSGNSIKVLNTCAFQSLMTHPSSQSIECSMLMGAIINKILCGEKDKRKILNFETLFDSNEKQAYKELLMAYECIPNDRIERIKRVEYDGLPSEKISGDGYCVTTLEAALWAFLSTDNFEDGLKKVVSLGDDTDTTGAVYGQIAGAYYGLENIKWRTQISWTGKIHTVAEKLFDLKTNK